VERFLPILQHTPWWVFVVLAVLIVTGAQALRPRVMPVWRLLIVPAIFIGWGILSAAQRSAAAPAPTLEPMLLWIVAAALGAAIGWTTTRLAGFAFEPNGSVRVPGTPVQLVRNVLIFVAKYGIAVSAAFATAGDRADIIFLDVAVSGLVAGYFMGWLARFVRARRASAAA
jgi:uncharacterized protein DUF6622